MVSLLQAICGLRQKSAFLYEKKSAAVLVKA
ncbi:hypothetical protein SVI_0537 [Shewanella violacea DSS12]|uniref:Uncharacterized protein n=1 Tax=Shewanella violacea (strain JCM 10179 / CIP 106290 / LMG 19151 / DSS12) TaxID=637905 RepID=D4ZFQ9_SHEVD|nr:hypothetical protein SVI_0537 [Shewanella violacea DSS12]